MNAPITEVGHVAYVETVDRSGSISHHRSVWATAEQARAALLEAGQSRWDAEVASGLDQRFERPADAESLAAYFGEDYELEYGVVPCVVHGALWLDGPHRASLRSALALVQTDGLTDYQIMAIDEVAAKLATHR